MPSGEQPPAPYTPPPNSPEAALLDGALLIPGKTPRVERELPPQHTAPPLASLGPALLQQDNQQLKDYHEWQQAAADADRAFDAEVGCSENCEHPRPYSYYDYLVSIENQQQLERLESMKTPLPSPKIPPDFPPVVPMPWPLPYPSWLPPKPWLTLEDKERKNFPLISGWVGEALFQAGYTVSKGKSIGANDDRLFGFRKGKNTWYYKSLFAKIGVTGRPDGIEIWESFDLPKFMSRKASFIEGSARPVLTVSLKPRGPLGWNSVLIIRYEDVWTVKVPDMGKVNGSSGVYMAISIQKVLVTAAVAVAVVAGARAAMPHLKVGMDKIVGLLKDIYRQPIPLEP